jgi:hypothetical protein
MESKEIEKKGETREISPAMTGFESPSGYHTLEFHILLFLFFSLRATTEVIKSRFI